jgi:hypothetical protein
MAWGFRKTKSFGPLRVNLSKSGLSFSLGVKGARLSFGKRGTFLNLSKGGFYYRKKIGSPKFNASANEFSNMGQINVPVSNITTDRGSASLTAELNKKSRRGSLLLALGIVPVLLGTIGLFGYSREQVVTKEIFVDVLTITKPSVHVRSQPTIDATSLSVVHQSENLEVLHTDSAGWIKVRHGESLESHGYVRADMGTVSRKTKRHETEMRIDVDKYLKFVIVMSGAGAIGWCYFLYRVDRRRLWVQFPYVLKGESLSLHNSFIEYFNDIGTSEKIWQRLDVQSVPDGRYHGGAQALGSRKTLKWILTNHLPYRRFLTNVQIPSIAFENTELHFLPDRLLVKKDLTYGGVLYKNLLVQKFTQHWIEESAIPQDAHVSKYVWKYTNVDGSPDRRFTGNEQLPLCSYSGYTFTLDDSVTVTLLTSKIGALDRFTSFVDTLGMHQKAAESVLRS